MFCNVVIVFITHSSRHWRRVGGGCRSPSSVALARLLADPGGGLLHLVKLLNELVQLRLRTEAETVDRVGSHVGPLAELLTRLGEGHVGRYGGVDHGLGALHADDPVQRPGGVVEEGDGNCGTGGGDPGTFGLGVNVEHMRLACEDRLLTCKYWAHF